MSPEESDLAERIYAAIQNASNYSERSQQSEDFRIGISDIGWCSEKVKRMLAGNPEPVTDKLKAFIGTAIGDHVEQACMSIWPEAVRQAEVSLTLVGDRGTYVLSGHPDLIVPNEGLVIDFKTSYGLALAEKNGPDDQKQYQRHGYAKAAYEAGLFCDRTLDEVQVANVWMDRAGGEQRLHVQMEPYDESWIKQAAMWVDDVVYAYVNDEDARKEPPREMCAKVCGHFATCRALDTDVQGLLTDDTVLSAVDLYQQGNALERQGRKLKDEAKAALNEVSGSTGEFTVRWVSVGPTDVNYTRAGYMKLDIRKIK